MSILKSLNELQADSGSDADLDVNVETIPIDIGNGWRNSVTNFEYLDIDATSTGLNNLRIGSLVRVYIVSSIGQVKIPISNSGLGHAFELFLSSYFSRYPKIVMIEASKGSLLRIKNEQSQWIWMRVNELDGSMIRLEYTNEQSEQKNQVWIYRGAPRFEKLHLQHIQTAKKTSISRGTSRVILTGGMDPTKDGTGRRVRVERSKFTFKDSMNRLGIKYSEHCEWPVKQAPDHKCNLICSPSLSFSSTSPNGLIFQNLKYFRKPLNPFHIPLIYGWRRNVACDVSYTAPCGRTVFNTEETFQLLVVSSSPLSIDQFTFSADVDIEVEANFVVMDTMGNIINDAKHRADDITRGHEAREIQCFNEYDDEKMQFEGYCAKRVFSGNIHMLSSSLSFLCGCDCRDGCLDPEKCDCRRETGMNARQRNDLTSYNKDVEIEYGISAEDYDYKRLPCAVITGIYECNLNCVCRSEYCLNSVVSSNGTIHVQLQVFKEPRKGWAVRIAHDVPPGCFICVYEGNISIDVPFGNSESKNHVEKSGSFSYEKAIGHEILDTNNGFKHDAYIASLDFVERHERSKSDIVHFINSELEVRKKRSSRSLNERRLKKIMDTVNKFNKGRPYCQLLKDTSEYLIDGLKIGNIGRFLNHSCDPNVFVQNVFTNSYDLRTPVIAFFTYRTVKAGEELCWDYQYQLVDNAAKEDMIYCHCRSENCRGRLR
ncbi:hypothetical protein ACOME3_002463 [Neoechinorhynchus agilis]